MTPTVHVRRSNLGKADLTILREVQSGQRTYTDLVSICYKELSVDNTTVDYSLRKLKNLNAIRKEGKFWVKGQKFDEILHEFTEKLTKIASVPNIYSLQVRRKEGDRLWVRITPQGSPYDYDAILLRHTENSEECISKDKELLRSPFYGT